MSFFRQTWTLTAKNLKIVLVRHPFTTFVRALLLPIILAAFFSYARNFSVSPACLFRLLRGREPACRTGLSSSVFCIPSGYPLEPPTRM